MAPVPVAALEPSGHVNRGASGPSQPGCGSTDPGGWRMTAWYCAGEAKNAGSDYSVGLPPNNQPIPMGNVTSYVTFKISPAF